MMLLALLVFALGSALCGAAQSMKWLIAARGKSAPFVPEVQMLTVYSPLSTVVQGLGGGGLISIPNIIVSDLVPLHERGAFQSILGL